MESALQLTIVSRDSYGQRSLRTTLCLIYPPKIVALAAIHVAGKYLEENLNECFGDVWRELYEPEIQEIQGKFMLFS